MFDFYVIYYLVIAKIKVLFVYFKGKKGIVSIHFRHLGTAAYTAAFLYWIEKGFDLNVIKLASSGIMLVYLAHKMSK